MLNKIVCLYCFLCLPLFALSNYSLVFIHIGKNFPDCSYTTLKQARFMNEQVDIYFLVDHKNYSQLSEKSAEFIRENKIHLVDLSLLPVTAKHRLFRQISPFDQSFKGGFWNHVTERFFYVYDFLEKTQLKNIIHLETDVMLYVDIEELLPSFLQSGAELAGTFQWTTECVPGLVFIRHLSIWEKYIDHILEELSFYRGTDPNRDLNDMRTLASFKKKVDSEFINLPIVMPEYSLYFAPRMIQGSHGNTSLDFLSKNEILFSGYLFDAAAFGIYANGYDRTVYPEGKPGDIHWKSLFDPSKMVFFWGEDSKKRNVPYVLFAEKSYRIVNLHFHSKHPEDFTSYQAIRKSF
jgi:hypothetical protein